MRKVHIHSVQPGDMVARTILTENGSVLLGAGVKLTQRFIERLKVMGIDFVFIEDSFTTDIIPEDVIRDDTRKHALETIHKTISTIMYHPLTKGRMSPPELGGAFRRVFHGIMQDLVSRKDVLVNLTNLHAAEGYLFHHSVNVAVLAGIIGLSKGYNPMQLQDLGVGALLFDIGMTLLPKELVNKQGVLSEEERLELQKHSQLGFDLLRSQHDISLVSAHCAFQHHERFDGSGYPRGLSGSDIHEYAQIVALADVYDALTSPRNHRPRYMPNEAIEFLFAAGNRYFDLNLIRLFCNHICIYPVGATVQLNTGQTAVVSEVVPGSLHRPTVRIIHEADGHRVSTPYEIDLRQEYTLTIVKTL